jgi:glutamyl/glutaminyl-tRNA synthetase
MVSSSPSGHSGAHEGRFAPSATGPLHLGSLRTALVAWLFARSQSARFLVRIEDLDPQRSRPEYERGQLDDLRALGLHWDEAPVRQSERMALYEDALARLDAQGRLYPCFCTRAEIRQAASAPRMRGSSSRTGSADGAARSSTTSSCAAPTVCPPTSSRSSSTTQLREWERSCAEPTLAESTPRQILLA